MGLRVRAAKSGARTLLWTGHIPRRRKSRRVEAQIREDDVGGVAHHQREITHSRSHLGLRGGARGHADLLRVGIKQPFLRRIQQVTMVLQEVAPVLAAARNWGQY